jgi:ADP-heptose:LPS heptosyltransferase
MRSRRFDIAINCQPDNWWTSFLCPAAVRIALYPSERLPLSSRAYTYAIPRPKRAGLHNTDHFLQATTAAGFPPGSKQMSVGETSDEAAFLAAFTERSGLDARRPLVVLAPFSTADNRSIPPGLAARVASWLVDDSGASVVVTAGPGDTQRLEAFHAETPQARVIVAHGTTVRQFVALVRQASLVVTVDSSPMHLAAALGTPYVALFGPTPVEERAPLAGNGVILSRSLSCAPCDLPTCSNPVFQQCIKLIALGDLQAAVRQLLPTASQAAKSLRQD